jgi:multidrug efflux pump subunit AcrA (membrane-fusion protein)
MSNNKKIKIQAVTVLCALTSLIATSCSLVSQEEHKKAPIAQTLDEDAYSYVYASLGDVIKSDSVDISYSSSKVWTMSYYDSYFIVSNVYFSKGDEVKKGDLLVECDPYDSSGKLMNLEEIVDELNEEYETYSSQIEYYSSLASLEEQKKKIYISYNQTFDSTNLDYYNKMVEDITKDLNVTTYELEEKQKLLDACKIYAPADGTIGYIAKESKWDMLSAGDTAVSVIESASEISAITTKYEYFTIGENYDVTFSVGNYVYNDEQIGKAKKDKDIETTQKYMVVRCTDIQPTSELNTTYKISFEYVSGDEDISGDTISGKIEIVLDEADSVTTIPRTALLKSGDGYAVYMENDDGSRKIQEVEVGVLSGTLAEIKSGLEIGDCVITDADTDSDEKEN